MLQPMSVESDRIYFRSWMKPLSLPACAVEIFEISRFSITAFCDGPVLPSQRIAIYFPSHGFRRAYVHSVEDQRFKAQFVRAICLADYHSFVNGHRVDVASASEVAVEPHFRRTENIFGAMALALSDDLLRAAQAATGHSLSDAVVLLLLNRQPSLAMARLQLALRLPYALTIRIINRLQRHGFVNSSLSERGGIDQFSLTPIGRDQCKQILDARQGVLARTLLPLTRRERDVLDRVVEKLLKNIVRDPYHQLGICRLCECNTCRNCPVDRSIHDASWFVTE